MVVTPMSMSHLPGSDLMCQPALTSRDASPCDGRAESNGGGEGSARTIESSGGGDGNTATKDGSATTRDACRSEGSDGHQRRPAPVSGGAVGAGVRGGDAEGGQGEHAGAQQGAVHTAEEGGDGAGGEEDAESEDFDKVPVRYTHAHTHTHTHTRTLGVHCGGGEGVGGAPLRVAS